jgi:multidrug resistance efflux pump
MDLRQVWVEANIVEDKIEKVRPGQYVEVDIDSLGRKVAGRVETVSPATVSASSLVQERSSSANASRGPGPVVPVKIALDEDRLMLIPGSSAEIKIWVR